jgi:metal-responsive CopG/Arc/MetJ family transcriptional regulator
MSVVNTNKRQKSKLVEFGICMPEQTIERIEAIKGPYLSRGKYILKAVDRLLAEEEEKQQVTIAAAVGAVPNST